MNYYKPFGAIITVLGLSSLSAYAGTVSSGGGQLYRYTNNPWWLENTNHVSYCVEVDQSTFPINQFQAEAMVEDALARWKAAFDFAKDSYYFGQDLLEPFGQLRVATQTFIKEECADTTDLRFQFGILSAQQESYFHNVNDFVGAAVRTKYDLENLRSKGFVYIAPLTGRLAPRSEYLSQEAWSICNHCLLKITLLHELGHVFGVPHSPEPLHLMHERLPEFIITQLTVEAISSGQLFNELETFLNPINLVRSFENRTVQGCQGLTPIMHNDLLGVPSDFQCIKLAIKENHIDVFAAKDNLSTYNLFGQIKWKSSGNARGPLIALDLPSSQKVFTKVPTESHGIDTVFGEEKISRKTVQGEYKSLDGQHSFPIKIEFKPNREIDAVVYAEGRFIDDFIYANSANSRE